MATFSSHAKVRAQQRSIPHWVARLLLEEGKRSPAPSGMLMVHFNARARRRIHRRAQRGEFAIGKLDHAWNSYLLVTRQQPHVVHAGYLGRRRIHRP